MNLLKRLSRARSGVIELTVVAVLLAIAVNLVASGLTLWLGLPFSSIVGAGLGAVVIIGVALAQLGPRQETVMFRGFVPVHDGELVRVENYRLANNVEQAIRAVRAENKALDLQWKVGPIVKPFDAEKPDANRLELNGGAARLLREALEYVFLDLLSLHLGDYFSRDPVLSKQTKELVREDLLNLLPNNRVLDALSRPIEERLPLVDRTSPSGSEDSAKSHRIQITRRTETENGVEDTIVSVFAGDFMYSRFDLSVPADVTVKRIAPGHIRLDGKSMQTDLRVEFNGFGYPLDQAFIAGYMVKNPRDFASNRGQCWSVGLTFSSKIRWRGILSPRSWRMQRWAEAFIEEVGVKVDGRTFLESIGWKTVAALIHTQRGLTTRKAIERAEAKALDPDLGKADPDHVTS